MALPDLVTGPLEADGTITVYEISSGQVVAEYEGLEVHNQLNQIKDLIAEWRNDANGHYCQTYNRGMADGLLRAADELQGVLNE
jgi:hypothetical protein